MPNSGCGLTTMAPPDRSGAAACAGARRWNSPAATAAAMPAQFFRKPLRFIGLSQAETSRRVRPRPDKLGGRCLPSASFPRLLLGPDDGDGRKRFALAPPVEDPVHHALLD